MTLDMTPVIVPKSDQISADDFIAGPRTFTIEAVSIMPGTEQPVAIKMAGEPRAWKPCKSMSRCLVAAWGPDANAYIGRSLTLYRDPKVKWGGMEVGGIRVSHLTHIERDMMLQLTATKGKRAPHIVKPLIAEVTPLTKAKQTAEEWAAEHMAAIAAVQSTDELDALKTRAARAMAKLATGNPVSHGILMDACDARRAELSGEGRDTADMGEAFTDGDDVGF